MESWYIRKIEFSWNLKVADVTPVYKKQDPTLVGNYLLFRLFTCVLKALKE